MPIYVYRCDCGHRFERLAPRDAEPPACPRCRSDTRKIPAAPRLGGRAAAGPAPDRVPPPWRGVHSGGAEKLHREAQFRERLTAKGVPETGPPLPLTGRPRGAGGGGT